MVKPENPAFIRCSSRFYPVKGLKALGGIDPETYLSFFPDILR